MPESKKKLRSSHSFIKHRRLFEKKENYYEINKKTNNNIYKIVSIMNMDILEQLSSLIGTYNSNRYLAFIHD